MTTVSNRFKTTLDQYLELFHAEKLEDFVVVKEALKSLIEPEKEHKVADPLKKRVKFLNNLILKSGSTSALIRTRIANRIYELNLLHIKKSKQVTQFVTLINDYLDKFKAEKIEDLNLISEALQSLLEPGHVIADPLKERVNSIRGLLEEPEMYALPQDINEFKNIMTARIIARIEELDSLNVEKSAALVRDQANLKVEREQNHQLMKKHAPPTGTAKTVTIEEMLLEEMYLDWQRYSTDIPFIHYVIETNRLMDIPDEDTVRWLTNSKFVIAIVEQQEKLKILFEYFISRPLLNMPD